MKFQSDKKPQTRRFVENVIQRCDVIDTMHSKINLQPLKTSPYNLHAMTYLGKKKTGMIVKFERKIIAISCDYGMIYSFHSDCCYKSAQYWFFWNANKLSNWNSEILVSFNAVDLWFIIQLNKIAKSMWNRLTESFELSIEDGHHHHWIWPSVKISRLEVFSLVFFSF